MEKEEKKQATRAGKRPDASRPRKKETAEQSVAAASPEPSADAPVDETVATDTESKKGKKTLYRVRFFYEWCKSCGICSAMCPVKIILVDEQGHPFIEDEDACIGCRNCEIHCPDFAITVKKRFPERRKTNGIS